MLPLINMVFLWLIFFMLAGKPTAEQVSIDPPRSTSPDPSTPQAFTLSMDGQGRLFINADMVQKEDLGLVLAQHPQVGSAASPLVLRAAATVEATKVVDVIHHLRDVGVDQLQLLTITDHG